ncbi:MAG: hypothetical protein RMK18_09090, partial [Armatimonadota bacterium]|nr:hypothetical protein [Armatimonadota bacterium]
MSIKGDAQVYDPPIGGSCYVYHPPTHTYLEYSRRAQLIYELQPTSAIDYDITPWGIEENTVVIVGWVAIDGNGNDAGGEFGYTPDGYSFHPVNDPGQVNCYRPRPDFVGILKIAPILDDIPIGMYSGMPTYDDDETVGDPWKMTVWEFWITNHCPEGWRPKIWDTLYFTAQIRPTVDHRCNSLAGIIMFHLYASKEPSFCLNACCGGYGEVCNIQVMCPLFPYCAYDEGLLWGTPECPWHQQLLLNGNLWKAMTIWDSDLKFVPSQEGFDVNAPECTMAATEVAVTDATVQVVCLDYGAFGFLTATCIHPILGGIEARLPSGVYDDVFSELFLLADYDVGIPYDYNLDGIADCWQDKHGWQYTSNPLCDADDTPQSNGTNGDGLSAYEEYRGLVARRNWKDFDPKVKDMFVMNFGAVPRDPENGDWNFVIPNEAITSNDG